MKTPFVLSAALTGLVLASVLVPRASAGAPLTDFGPDGPRPAIARAAIAPGDTAPVQFYERDLSGPRVGFTVAPSGPMYRALRDNDMGAVVSQFGWHFEHQIAPTGGGPQLLTQFVPLFGGVEYGKLIPTLTIAAGVRLPSGTEFGVGPSFTLVNSEGRSKSGLMLAIGRTIPYSGVSIPLNLAVTLNDDGTRVTMLAGYAIRRAAR